jgi:hypothetical protein
MESIIVMIKVQIKALLRDQAVVYLPPDSEVSVEEDEQTNVWCNLRFLTRLK